MSGNLIVTIDREQKPLALTTSRFNQTIYIIHLVIRVRRRALVFSIQACVCLNPNRWIIPLTQDHISWRSKDFCVRNSVRTGKTKSRSRAYQSHRLNEFCLPTNSRRTHAALPFVCRTALFIIFAVYRVYLPSRSISSRTIASTIGMNENWLDILQICLEFIFISWEKWIYATKKELLCLKCNINYFG